MCKYVSYPNAQFTSTGNGTPISSNGTHFHNVLFRGPILKIVHLVRSQNWQTAITGTGGDSFRPISGIGLCQFRNGCF